MQKLLFLKCGFIIIILLTLPEVSTFAQGESDSTEKKFLRNNIFFGFNYHLQISYLDIAPIVEVSINKKIHVGAGVNYLYYYRNSLRIGKTSIGANVFTRIFFTKNVYNHVEYLYSEVPYLNKLIYEYHNVKKGDFYVGGGYKQPFSNRIHGFFTLLVNLSKTPESPYNNLILLKAGATF